MELGADERNLLPVACTLGPADGAERLQEWRRITSAAGVGRELSPGKLTLRFRDLPTVQAELNRLVDAERHCCQFLGWDLRPAASEWHVEITGSDEDLRTLLIAE